jgi:hypothetical protein
VIDPGEYDDVLVRIAHPAGDVEVPLPLWIQEGPGPRRYLQLVSARRDSDGAVVRLDEIPLQFHNSRKSRLMQRLRLLPRVWGPSASP